jgi:hypothetical protein
VQVKATLRKIDNAVTALIGPRWARGSAMSPPGRCVWDSIITTWLTCTPAGLENGRSGSRSTCNPLRAGVRINGVSPRGAITPGFGD